MTGIESQAIWQSGLFLCRDR